VVAYSSSKQCVPFKTTKVTTFRKKSAIQNASFLTHITTLGNESENIEDSKDMQE